MCSFLTDSFYGFDVPFTFTISLFKFSLSSFILPLSSLNILITIVLNSVSGWLPACIAFISFSGDFFYSYHWGMFLCLSILAAHFFCICFCVWGVSSMSPSLGVVALYSTVFLITRARYSRNVPCVDYVSSLDIVEFWLLLAWPCMGLTLRLGDCEDWPWPQCMSCCVSADHMKQNLPQKDLVPAEISLWTCHVRS